jgi:hypothetical protein
MKKPRKHSNFLAVFIALFFLPILVYAHPGRTDASGCHTCRTNCSSWGLSTGEYHCHRSKGVSQPTEPIKSTYGQNGTGYTTPAPEYKTPKTESWTQTSAQPGKTTTEKKSWFSKLFSWFK